MFDKKSLRSVYLAKRNALSTATRQEGSLSICKHITSTSLYRNAEHIMAYLAIGGEVSLDAFINYALADGKKIYVPVCTDKKGHMVAVRLLDLSEVVKGTLGIRIPKSDSQVITPEELDCVLVPGVTFDKGGRRLGMGGGYYDRFLTNVMRDKRVGIAWSQQISIDILPVDEYDQLMGSLITEKEIIACQHARRRNSIAK